MPPDRLAEPAGFEKVKIHGKTASEVRPWGDESASYWKSSTPCATIAHPVGDGFQVANQNCLLDSSVQRGTSIFLTLNPGADTLGCISEKLRIVCVDEVAA